ncbi:MAG: HAMP domain-containing sensor histidine kinase [Ginsengibacter sp.]
MKLISKYNRFTMPVIVLILLISGLLFYYILHYILLRQVDKDLRIEQSEIIHFVNEKKSLPETADYKDQKIDFIPSTADHYQENFATIRSKDKQNNNEIEDESFRRFQFLVKVDGKNYIARVTKSQQETEDIVTIISLLTLSIIGVLLVILAFINRIILANVWRPFYNSLEIIRHYKISGEKKINFSRTDIDEFAQMQSDFSLMAEKATNDYRSLKTFTENASHEMQTPLAIIRNKLEIFSQNSELNKKESQLLYSVHAAANRLSKLNESLLLLTKIENDYFINNESVNFSKLLSDYIETIKEPALIQNITINATIDQGVVINMNEPLAEILISNVVSNAFKHNYRDGEMNINLSQKEFRISNTGKEPMFNTEMLIERFQKDSANPDSIGLGLSIVKKITESYGFLLSYLYKNKTHIITILFKN